ncbi:EXLDI protein [Kribbella monticola]|uniref:EXLDI protein n=1 Tax=Kribbella monticola TaxID=2185285 RepID=UPI000DD477F1|nr:EXLDI protein [Kribbella monticola]
MPNKTIYVSDDDLALYKRAQELAGNLSQAISIALRRYVELEEGRLDGFDEITVRVGRGAGRKQRFSGVLLAEGGRSNKNGYEAFKVYRSRTGKFVLYADRTNQFTANQTVDGEDQNYTGWRSWIGSFSSNQTWSMAQGEATLHVVDTLEELHALIPDDLYALVEEAADQPAVEDLNI